MYVSHPPANVQCFLSTRAAPNAAANFLGSWASVSLSHVPWVVAWLLSKGEDCERVNGWHRWYNQDNVSSACYHCEVLAHGRLWEGSHEPGA